jgi:hypothetical protein
MPNLRTATAGAAEEQRRIGHVVTLLLRVECAIRVWLPENAAHATVRQELNA